MFMEETLPHKVLKRNPLSTVVTRKMYPDVNEDDSGVLTGRSTDETDDGDDNYPMKITSDLRSSNLSVEISSSNVSIGDMRDVEIEEGTRREEEDEEDEEEEFSSSQLMPVPVSKQPSKFPRLGNLTPTPEPDVINLEVKKKSKKTFSNKINK